MTTICYRDGVLAADSRAYSGDKMPIGIKKKLHRLSNGALLASSSRVVGNTDAFAAWCQAAIDEKRCLPDVAAPEDYDIQGLLIWTDGKIYYWNDSRSWAGPLEAEFFAIGSGEQFAYGAMMAGASAEEAVRIACACDPWTDGPVRTLRFEGPFPEPKKTRSKRKRK